MHGRKDVFSPGRSRATWGIAVNPNTEELFLYDAELEDLGGAPYVNGRDTGSPEDWVLVPLADTSFGAAGNQSWVFTGEVLTILFEAGIPFPTITLPDPIIPFHSGPAPSHEFIGTMPSGSGFDGRATAQGPGFKAGALRTGHVVGSTETEASATGAQHRQQIDPAAEHLTVSEASRAEVFDFLAGGDLGAGSGGRQLQLLGVSLEPGGTLSIGTDDGLRTFTLAGAGQPAQVVGAQLQENDEALQLRATVPAGKSGVIQVDDWNALATSLVWEDIGTDSSMTVLVLQDNPAQRLARVLADLDAALQVAAGSGPGASIQAKLTAARAKVVDGQYPTASNVLNALANELEAQAGKKLPSDLAAAIGSQVGEAAGLLNAQ